MKILLDECITKRLKPHLPEDEVYTVSDMNWRGIRNGKLLALSVENNFDVFLTIDKNLLYQQNLQKFEIAVVVLNALTSKIEELKTFIPAFKAESVNFLNKQSYLINK